MDIHRLYKAAMIIDLDDKIIHTYIKLKQLEMQRNIVAATPIFPKGGLPIVGGGEVIIYPGSRVNSKSFLK